MELNIQVDIPKEREEELKEKLHFFLLRFLLTRELKSPVKIKCPIKEGEVS